jgi:hypothetical protein
MHGLRKASWPSHFLLHNCRDASGSLLIKWAPNQFTWSDSRAVVAEELDHWPGRTQRIQLHPPSRHIYDNKTAYNKEEFQIIIFINQSQPTINCPLVLNPLQIFILQFILQCYIYQIKNDKTEKRLSWLKEKKKKYLLSLQPHLVASPLVQRLAEVTGRIGPTKRCSGWFILHLSDYSELPSVIK